MTSADGRARHVGPGSEESAMPPRNQDRPRAVEPGGTQARGMRRRGKYLSEGENTNEKYIICYDCLV